jgi:maltose alpha-D-glucosyltransferase/alpha-amylase
MHLALAASDDPAFVPESIDAGVLDTMASDMQRHASGIFGLLQDRLPTLGDAARAQADAVLAARSMILDELDRVRRVDGAGLRTRIHGDYHLGQVLRVEEDFVILDFEGEPARPLSERRAKQSPLKDVAGMVRSFSYAAYAALFAFTVHAPADYAPLEPWADAWQHWAADAFLQGYRGAIGDAAVVPRGAAFSELLRAFALDKAMYELGYELNNRPDWVRIPLTGILKVAGGLQS